MTEGGATLTSVLRYAAGFSIAFVLLLAPAYAGAQTTCEYGASMTMSQAAGAAITGSDAAQSGNQDANRPAIGGLSDLFGAAAGGTVAALGGDTGEVDRSMAQQREREQNVSAMLGTLAALPC
jgi:hypothetical protein